MTYKHHLTSNVACAVFSGVAKINPFLDGLLEALGFNYSTEHARKERILTAAIDDGFNTCMFCDVLDRPDHLLLRRYEYECSDCWSCYCHLPDKDSPRIGDKSA